MPVLLTRAARAVGRLLAPATGAVSGLGWAVLALAVVCGGAGWWLGWVELTTVGAAAGVAILVAMLLSVGKSIYDVDLELSHNRVTVGERAVGRIQVRNASRRRLLPAQIELPVGRGAADFHLPSLAPQGVHEDVFAIPTTRRSVIVVGPVRSVRGDPLGLLRRRVRWTDPVDLYVHPELVSLAGASSGMLRDLEGQATRVVSDSDMSFHALRDYVPGDDRRHIHWRSSARIGELMVRQFEDTRRTHTAVALSTARADYADEQEFELAVSAAASIAVQALRDERDLTVLAGADQLRTDTPARLLDDVSALELGASLPVVGGRGRGGNGSESLAQELVRHAPDASVAIMVTGSVPSAAELRLGAAHIPVGVRTLVLVCETGVRLDAGTHGSLSMARVGSLTDLPRVLRRVVGT